MHGHMCKSIVQERERERERELHWLSASETAIVNLNLKFCELIPLPPSRSPCLRVQQIKFIAAINCVFIFLN